MRRFTYAAWIARKNNWCLLYSPNYGWAAMKYEDAIKSNYYYEYSEVAIDFWDMKKKYLQYQFSSEESWQKNIY